MPEKKPFNVKKGDKDITIKYGERGGGDKVNGLNLLQTVQKHLQEIDDMAKEFSGILTDFTAEMQKIVKKEPDVIKALDDISNYNESANKIIGTIANQINVLIGSIKDVESKQIIQDFVAAIIKKRGAKVDNKVFNDFDELVKEVQSVKVEFKNITKGISSKLTFQAVNVKTKLSVKYKQLFNSVAERLRNLVEDPDCDKVVNELENITSFVDLLNQYIKTKDEDKRKQLEEQIKAHVVYEEYGLSKYIVFPSSKESVEIVAALKKMREVNAMLITAAVDMSAGIINAVYEIMLEYLETIDQFYDSTAYVLQKDLEKVENGSTEQEESMERDMAIMPAAAKRRDKMDVKARKRARLLRARLKRHVREDCVTCRGKTRRTRTTRAARRTVARKDREAMIKRIARRLKAKARKIVAQKGETVKRRSARASLRRKATLGVKRTASSKRKSTARRSIKRTASLRRKAKLMQRIMKIKANVLKERKRQTRASRIGRESRVPESVKRKIRAKLRRSRRK